MTQKEKRNEAILKYLREMITKNKIEKKYKTAYLVRLTADKFYLQPRTIYEIMKTKKL